MSMDSGATLKQQPTANLGDRVHSDQQCAKGKLKGVMTTPGSLKWMMTARLDVAEYQGLEEERKF